MARKRFSPAVLPETMTVAEFGAMIGMAPRNARDLSSRGLAHLDADGRVRVAPSLKAYIEHLRQQAQGRKGENGIDLASERAMFAKEQRIEQQMRNARLRGELISLSDVKIGWTRFASVVRIAFLGLPTKIISAVPHMSPHDGQVVAEVCRNVLIDTAEELGDGSVTGAEPDDLSAGNGEIVAIGRSSVTRKARKRNAKAA